VARHDTHLARRGRKGPRRAVAQAYPPQVGPGPRPQEAGAARAGEGTAGQVCLGLVDVQHHDHCPVINSLWSMACGQDAAAMNRHARTGVDLNSTVLTDVLTGQDPRGVHCRPTGSSWCLVVRLYIDVSGPIVMVRHERRRNKTITVEPGVHVDSSVALDQSGFDQAIFMCTDCLCSRSCSQ